MATRAGKTEAQTDGLTLAALEAWLVRHAFWAAWTAGHIIIALGYFWLFMARRASSVDDALASALINTGSSWLTGLLFAIMLTRFVLTQRVIVQAGAHVALAPVFSFGWYIIDISLLGWRDGSLLTGALIEPFQGPAFLWQYFQGFAVYGALAALVYATRRRPSTANSEPRREAAPVVRASSLLVRDGEELVSLSIEDILLVTSADDYVEIDIGTRVLTVRKTMRQLEDELPERFVRVHRGAIVNLDRVVRAEPGGGGRMVLHLEEGRSVTASKSGARALRERSL
ncbi:LytTR family DNA-binding domain-containing protein [Erythrobacter sp. JK5]|uniref:LytTR family DNA-binding domain-containing protein n=1 Tax=Erythrobacter sp. JK5 TaxID=2829500 RepID=UPI001BA63752|nr:LytTR family DNA-binding domain-containing protein [Erythrobacter sp. JK5]QUL37058.1 LytTR family transcriptional regulator [Erythrobacter sp. JK5]